MKKSIILSCLLALGTSSAYAENSGVTTLLNNDPNVSEFYQAAINSGVLASLAPDATYTVFAPVNRAFTPLSTDAACLQSPECNAQIVTMLRNHIVRGKVHIEDVQAHKGGLFSINDRFINTGEPNRGLFTVDGQPIVRSIRAGGSIMYTIDGVIANPRELATLDVLQGGATPQVTISNRTTQHVIPDPSCPPPGCPDSRTHTIERTETYITPEQ